MKTNHSAVDPLNAVRALIRGQHHGGYTFAALMDDSALLCAGCVRANARQILKSTRDRAADGWQVIGLTNSGEWDSNEAEYCAHCAKDLQS